MSPARGTMEPMPSPRRPRIVVVGDVGGGSTLHVGDEAMTETAVAELRRRGLDGLLLLSRNPADTRARYGVASIQRIGFAGLDHDAVMARLDRVLRLLEGDGDALPPGDPAHTVIRTVRDADAVLIAGGGNITTLYAEHLAERAAVGAIAARAGIPLAIGGQSLGPDFSAEDSLRVAALLRSSHLTAAREPGSFALGRALAPGTRLVETGDDAVLLGPADASDEEIARRHCLVPGGFVALSFSPASGPLGYATLLDDLRHLAGSIAARTGLPLVLVRHEGAVDAAASLADDAIAEALAPLGVTSPRVLDARTSAALTRSAALCVTSRYHGAVFALAGAVPTVALWPERYSLQKMQGLLAHHGLDDWCAPLSAIGTGHAERLISAAWEHRGAIAEHLASARPAARAHAEQWWDAVAAVLTGREPSIPGPYPTPPRLDLEGSLAAELRRMAALTLAAEGAGGHAGEDEAARWQARVRELETSNSWRMTAPLRAVSGFLRGHRDPARGGRGPGGVG